MATISALKHFPAGWMFGVLGSTWFIGFLDSTIPFAKNTKNVWLVKKLDPSNWTKRFFVVGIHKADIEYDSATKTLTLAPGATVKGQGFDSLSNGLQAMRAAAIADEAIDPGDFRNLKNWRRWLGKIYVP